MSGVRVDLIFPGAAPEVDLPCAMQTSAGVWMTLIGKDTPLLRAKLIELILANPGVDLAVSNCFLGQMPDFKNPHDLVRTAFGEVTPAPLSFNVKDASKRLGISYSHMRELIRLGDIKKVHGRVASAEIDRYLKDGRSKSPRQPRGGSGLSPKIQTLANVLCVASD